MMNACIWFLPMFQIICARNKRAPGKRRQQRRVLRFVNQKRPLNIQIRGSIVVSISACHADDPGSIPGRGVFSANARGPTRNVIPCAMNHWRLWEWATSLTQAYSDLFAHPAILHCLCLQYRICQSLTNPSAVIKHSEGQSNLGGFGCGLLLDRTPH